MILTYVSQRATLPHMQSAVIVLLKLLLATVAPTNVSNVATTPEGGTS